MSRPGGRERESTYNTEQTKNKINLGNNLILSRNFDTIMIL